MGKPIVALCSYGHSGHFSSTRLSLLDRGFVYAIAHSSEDLGRQWYEGGKLLKKKMFKDFIACSTYLIDQNILPAHLYAEGGSAGGLLMGLF
jgi:oligopeptidase B